MKHLLLAIALCLGISGLSYASEPININAATAEQMADAFQGIGPLKAATIVDYREKFGPFKTVDDLTDVYGVGERLVELNRDRMVAGPAAPKPAAPAPDTNNPETPRTAPSH